MTQEELHDEFWLLTKGILQDAKIDTAEARIIRRWLEEHGLGDRFSFLLEKLGHKLSDGYLDRFEAKEVIDSLGFVLRELNANAGR